MVKAVFLNNCAAEGSFGPGLIVRRIPYDKKSRDKIALKLVRNDSAKLYFFAVIVLFIFFVGIHINPQILYSNLTHGNGNRSSGAQW